MTVTETVSMFTALVVLAIIPGPGIMTVIARSSTKGLKAGLFTSAGIVAGDWVFILMAVFGLNALSLLMGEFFVVIKILGSAYLILLGLRVIFSTHSPTNYPIEKEALHSASFAAGLLTTLSNPKAILFYVSFFPAFLDLSSVTVSDGILVLSIATVAVGSVMGTYAYLAIKMTSQLHRSSLAKSFRFSAGGLLMGSGIYLATRSQS